jgi:hypothetical protein
VVVLLGGDDELGVLRGDAGFGQAVEELRERLVVRLRGGDGARVARAERESVAGR